MWKCENCDLIRKQFYKSKRKTYYIIAGVRTITFYSGEQYTFCDWQRILLVGTDCNNRIMKAVLM